MKLALGIIPLLIVAGTIEGFVSPTDLAARWKYSLAAFLFVLLILFLIPKAVPARHAVEASVPEKVAADYVRYGNVIRDAGITAE